MNTLQQQVVINNGCFGANICSYGIASSLEVLACVRVGVNDPYSCDRQNELLRKICLEQRFIF